jgi:hypothetical protein
MNKRLYDALIKKYEAQIAEGEATLEIYFTNSVGIGEHPQHLEEMDKYVTMITDAKDKKDTLEQLYKYNSIQWR